MTQNFNMLKGIIEKKNRLGCSRNWLRDGVDYAFNAALSKLFFKPVFSFNPIGVVAVNPLVVFVLLSFYRGMAWSKPCSRLLSSLRSGIGIFPSRFAGCAKHPLLNV